jgi:hypothetical protein
MHPVAMWYRRQAAARRESNGYLLYALRFPVLNLNGLILIISTLLLGINLIRKHNTLSAG